MPGKQNGVDVSINMMMPLVDMLNHRGKECSFLLSDESQEESNVRYDMSCIVFSRGSRKTSASFT